MATRELLTVKPQFKSEVGRSNYSSHVEIADEPLLASEARTRLGFENQLVVFHARQVTANGAEGFCRS